jgi:hypothetical protein
MVTPTASLQLHHRSSCRDASLIALTKMTIPYYQFGLQATVRGAKQ